MTTVEAPWDDEQRAHMLALWQVRATTCPGCHQPMEESTSPEHDPASPTKTGEYRVALPTRCHACTALDAARDAYRHEPGARPHGLMWRAQLHPVEPRRPRG